MEWVSVEARTKPKLNQRVIIWREFTDSSGQLCDDFYSAFYIVNPNDKRKRCFANWPPDVTNSPWVYDSVTHWAIPNAPLEATEKERGSE
jgi:hypothetical protein